MSKYRNITVDGRDYRYMVGKANIVIRDNDNDRFKLVLAKPDDIDRYGVVYPNYEVSDSSIRIFVDPEQADKFFHEQQELQKNHPNSDGWPLVEFANLQPTPVPITPAWIADAIRQHAE